MLKETNFWLTTVEQPTFPQIPLPNKIDVAVIGGGFSGLSAARTLAKGGASVIVLEAQTVGWGASSRNGGMVLAGMKLSVETLIKRYGLERTKRLFTMSLASIDTVEQIVADESIDCTFSRYGCLEVAWKPSHFDKYARAAEEFDKHFGFQMHIVPKAALRAEIGSDLYHGGLVDEISAGINPAQFVMGLAKAAEKAGAQIHENTNVRNVERGNNGGFEIKTSRGNIKADRIFVGTNGYTTNATPSFHKRSIPIGSYIIATAPLSDDLAHEVSPKNRMIFDSKHYLYYFRLTPDNRMLFGGRAAFMPETTSSVRDSAKILRRGMLDVYPQLKDVSVEHVWGGTLSFTFDMMPHAGQMDGMNYALGYAGHGVAFATHLGQQVAKQMLGDAIENPLAELTFPGAPFGSYNGTPWFLPFAGAYHKVLDWLT